MSVPWWSWPLAAAVLALALSSQVSAGDDGGGVKKLRLWRMLEKATSLTTTQRYFLMLTAYGEGGYNPAAHNGSATERDAAQRALERNPAIAAMAMNCGLGASALASGSWGTFQRLAPYWASDMHEIFGGAACQFIDPSQHTDDLALQVADAIHLARSLQNYGGWKAAPTVGNLRLGWANPGFMGYLSDHTDRLDKYRTHAARVRLPDGIVDARIEVFPSDALAIYAQLRGAA